MANIFHKIEIIPWSTKRDNTIMNYINKKESYIINILNGGMESQKSKFISHQENKLTRIIKETLLKIKLNKEIKRKESLSNSKIHNKEYEVVDRFMRNRKIKNFKIPKILMKSSSTPIISIQDKQCRNERNIRTLPPIVKYHNMNKSEYLINVLQKSLENEKISNDFRNKINDSKIFYTKLTNNLGVNQKFNNHKSIIINGKKTPISNETNIKVLKDLNRLSPQISRKLNNIIINYLD